MFKYAFQNYLSLSYVQEKSYTYTTLKGAEYSFEFNKWILKVQNEIAKKSILQIRDDLIKFLRTECNNPSIILEIIIDETAIKEEIKQKTMTSDEKRKQMEVKNNALILLQQKFNTFMN